MRRFRLPRRPRSLVIQVGGIFFCLLLLSLGMAGIVYAHLEARRPDAWLVNMSGRQRMLTQRMAKELLRLRTGEADAGRRLQRCARQYAHTLRLLREGDPARGIPPAPPVIRRALEDLQGFWRQVEAALAPWYDADGPRPSARQLTRLLAAHESLLTRSDEVVRLFQERAEMRLARLRRLLRGLIAAGMVIFAVLLLFLHRALRPVRTLALATQRVAAGERDLRLRPEGPLEFHRLTEAFNRMVATLRRTEREHRRKAHHLEHMLRTAPDGIVSVDAQGRIVAVNPAAERLFRYRREELLAKPLLRLVPPRLRQTHREGFQRYVRTGQQRLPRWEHLELPGWTRDGREIPLDVSFSASAFEGEVLITAVLRDATPRKRVEAQLRGAKATAEAAAAAKSAFLANMSHEIRTPMNGILGMAELLLDTRLDAEQREYLETLRTCAESLLGLLNDILDFSKIEAGKLHLETVPFSLRAVLTEALRAVALKAHGKGLHLVLDVEPEVPDRLEGDPLRVRQIVLNLVHNAVKFTDRGGVTVTCRRSPGAAHRNRVTLRLEVRDTGVGIPPDRQREVFGAFVQSDASTTRRYGGTGLGLAIVARLVDLMGGTLRVASMPGQGTTFHVALPFRLPTERDGPHPDLARLRGLPICVVESHPPERRWLRRRLRSWGLAVRAAPGPAGAQRLWRRSPSKPRLAVVGLAPGEASRAAVTHLREALALPQLPVLLVRPTRPQVKGGDATRVILKPIHEGQLLEVLLELLAGRRRPLRRAPTAAPARERGLRILVAEDNPVNQRIAERLLTKGGHRVAVVSTGRAAVETVTSHPDAFDLVLMDVQMPDMDGLEAARRLRAHERERGLRRLPILALTAHALKGDRERCLAAGMDGYLTKPIRVEQLMHALAAVAAGHLGPAPAPADDGTGGRPGNGRRDGASA